MLWLQVTQVTMTISDEPSPNGQADWLLKEICWYYPVQKIDHQIICAGILPSDFEIEKFLSYVAADLRFR